MSPLTRRGARLLAAAALVAACNNAGADRVLTIPGAGQVRGLIYLDRDGSTTFTPADSVLANARIQLIALGTVDTVKRATSDTGTIFAGVPVNFAFPGVAVGTYRVNVDTLTIPHDSMRITRMDSTVAVTPGDTAFVRIAVGYPAATPTAARALALGTRLFVVGIAVANENTFGDSTNSLADAAGAIRLVRVPAIIVAAGDSIRVRGVVDSLDGQRTLRVDTVMTLGILKSIPTSTLTVGQAKTASGGAADAGLVNLYAPAVRVVILDTLTGPAGRILHVKDTTASLIDTLEVHLDSAAQFDSTALKRDTVGARVHLKGILLPSTVPGRWLLKPRTPADQS